MLVKILPHGSGKSRGGTSAKEYLLGKDNDRVNARLLKGDPDITTEIINGLKFAKSYTSGGIHFAYDEAKDLTEQDKYDIIESFEKTMFPNLEESQVSGYWVEHTDKVNEQGERRLELNFIYASVDLESGKALPVYYHANDKHLTSAWRDYTNIKYDLIDPLEVQRQQTIKIASNLPKHKKEILNDIHEIITAKVVEGEIKNRADIVETLQAIDGIELLGKPLKNKYITIKDPDNNGKNIRLRGAIYDDPQWTIQGFVRQLEETETADTRPKSERLAEAEKRLRKSVSKRAERFEKRFSAVKQRSAERAERLESDNIKQSTSTRAESTSTRAERERFNSADKQQNQAESKASTARNQDNKQQTFSRNANADATARTRNISVERDSNTRTVSNDDNALPHREAETVFLVDTGLDSNFNNSAFNPLGDSLQQTRAGRIIDEQVTRADNFRQLERDTDASTATSTRATDATQESRTATLEQLTEQLERTTNSVSDFAKQIRPSPFKQSIRQRERETDSDRQQDERYQYTYDRDRRTEREQSRRIESAFRQIDTSTEQAILLDERITRAKQEIEQRKVEADKPQPEPTPPPPPTPTPTPSRSFRP